MIGVNDYNAANENTEVPRGKHLEASVGKISFIQKKYIFYDKTDRGKEKIICADFVVDCAVFMAKEPKEIWHL